MPFGTPRKVQLSTLWLAVAGAITFAMCPGDSLSLVNLPLR
jgi:hypothetical protein